MDIIGKEITVDTLREWLDKSKHVNILDVRPEKERLEWYIPGSIHLDLYDKLKRHDKNVLQDFSLDKAVPVVTVCAAGKTSALAAGILQQQGYEAYSLSGGMKAWSLAWNTARLTFPDFTIIQVRRTGKGCLSYILVSNNEGIVIDASLPVHVYEQLVQKEQIKLKFILETHIHADHLSRSLELAQYYNIPLYLPVPNKVRFDFIPVKTNQEFIIGNITATAVETPGHTSESTCFLVDDKVLFSGDTLFTNGVGRPDLNASHNEVAEKSKLLYHSLQQLIKLEDKIIVLPAHTDQPVDFDGRMIRTTIADVKNNVGMLQMSEKEFLDALLKKLPPTPANYLTVVEKNLQGDFRDVDPLELEAGANRCAIS